MKRKWLTAGIILLFIGTCVIPALAQNTEKQSVSRGTWLYVGGSGPGNYTRIQNAIDDSSDGDTVFVYDDSSPYFEQIFVNNSIILTGENKETTILNSIGNEDILEIQSDNVVISGFTIQNSINRGIRVVRFHNITIYENIFVNNREDIELLVSCYNYIHDNCFYANSAYSRIYLEDGSSNNVILRNVIQNSGEIGYGMWIDGDNNEIKFNVFENNYVGIHLDFGEYNIISYNLFKSNRKYAIYIWDTEFSIITNNNFINNGCMIIEAVYINQFTYISTVINIIFSTMYSTQIDSNYWDTYKGIGPKRVGCKVFLYFLRLDPEKDFWFMVNWLSLDWHPASEPYDIS